VAGSASAALFFSVFLLPSIALALLALRDFEDRADGPPGHLVRRGRKFLALAAALPVLLVALTTLLLQGLPLAGTTAWTFLGVGLACAALGSLGWWLFPKAAGEARRSWQRAAETVPLVLALLDATLLLNALPL
jgi:hypothetical protein